MKYRSGLELADRCSYINFTPETFNRNNILKSTIADFVFNCNKAVNSHIEIIAEFKRGVGRLVQENTQLKEDKLQLLEEVQLFSHRILSLVYRINFLIVRTSNYTQLSLQMQ